MKKIKNLLLNDFLIKILTPYRWWYILIFQAPILTVLYVFSNNYSIKLMVDTFSTEEISYQDLAIPIILFISAQIGLETIWRLSNFASLKIIPKIHRAILLHAYNYIQNHSLDYFQRTANGSIVSKIRGIIEGFELISLCTQQVIIKNFFIVIVSIFLLLLVSTTVFVFMIVWVTMFCIVMLPMALKLNKFSHKVAESKHHIIGCFSDNFSNIFTIASFAKQRPELNRTYSIISKNYMVKLQALYRYDFKFNITGTLFYWTMLSTIFLFMVYLRKRNLISTGDFLFVLLTTLAIAMNLWTLIMGLSSFLKYFGDFRSALSILEVPQEQVDAPNAKAFKIRRGEITFKNVSYGHDPEHLIFSNLNLRIRSGERIGLIGPSGSGKTTLVMLLLKHLRPMEGEIMINHIPLQDFHSDSLRQQIAVIPQETYLFNRSIAENIGYARENATFKEIQEAAELADIHSFIESLPEKYDTIIEERGFNLSGGQRQRIAIARALLKKAPILILDEATSNLDPVSEHEIEKSIQILFDLNKPTVIAIAHKHSTIQTMDRIFSIENNIMTEKTVISSNLIL